MSVLIRAAVYDILTTYKNKQPISEIELICLPNAGDYLWLHIIDKPPACFKVETIVHSIACTVRIHNIRLLVIPVNNPPCSPLDGGAF
jgi:hypothetical protein